MDPRGIFLGLIATGLLFGGIWISWAFGITDIVDGVAFIVLLTVVPFVLHEKLMSAAARAKWEQSNLPITIEVVALFVLAYIFYKIVRVPFPSMYDSPLIRFVGCLYLAWPCVMISHIIIDRGCDFYGPSTNWLDQKMDGLLGLKRKEPETPPQRPVIEAPHDTNDSEIAFDPRRFGLPTKAPDVTRPPGPWDSKER